ncbi:hypothetical protein SASPL_143011 [Salvia splendens]|uniref:LysM domain-containing protein n=1 Tax=Salvia splendens TaxID=180675 RepID=A0A8X8ZAE5_SALSN|nr:uncharacterized protein LOC121772024 [Salvia splendens]KAG6396854.1 hypothetical protein SASPL_143011 [Salvia splendens]
MNEYGGAELYQIGAARSSSPTISVPIHPPPSSAVGVGANGGLNYIVHTVSKYDTLAGVAIKYGVEVGDIKRLNGLVTDLQMFALKTIQIPHPGRHPPSPVSSNGHKTPPRPCSTQQTLSSYGHSDLFDSFSSLKLKSKSSSETKVSLSMSRMQYYGLRSADIKGAGEGCEMAMYKKGGAHYLEDGPLLKSSISSPPLSHYRKSKSAADCLDSENGSLIDQDFLQGPESNGSAELIDKLVKRRQKSEADFTSRSTEKLLKEENSNGTAVSAITGKGLALRPKSSGRTVSLGADGEAGGFKPIPIGLGDAFLNDDVNGVKKSSSVSSLQDSDNSALSSIWPTSKWSLKQDFQALSAAAMTSPIFDGLPKPSNWRSKAAVD